MKTNTRTGSRLAIAILASSTLLAPGARAADTIKDDAENAAHKAAVGVKSMAFDAVDKRSVTVDFDKGSSVLPNGEERDVEALIKSFDPGISVGDVSVAAWSDKSLPTDQTKLTDADQSLAKSRLAVVEACLKKLGVTGHIETYNMASAANPIAKLLATDDAKVKDAYQTSETDSPRAAEVAHYLRTAGGPTKAVVVFHQPGVK